MVKPMKKRFQTLDKLKKLGLNSIEALYEFLSLNILGGNVWNKYNYFCRFLILSVYLLCSLSKPGMVNPGTPAELGTRALLSGT